MHSTAAIVAGQLAPAKSAGMDEESFRLFYQTTARMLRAYLASILEDRSLADDIVQDSYLRLLGAKLPVDMSSDHRKNYLFRIATNLARSQPPRAPSASLYDSPSPHVLAEEIVRREDMRQIMRQLKPRHRELLWLAYVERFSHAEIAEIVGAKEPSIRPMLARARETFAELVRASRSGIRKSILGTVSHEPKRL